MNRVFIVFLATALALSMTPAVSSAADTEKTTWKDIFSEVAGRYPLSAEQKEISPRQKGKLDIPKNWEFDFGLERFLMSHTTYEIGSHTGSFERPLSRLKFPMNTWWLDFKLRRTSPRWSMGGRAAFAVSTKSDGMMKDWDWETDDDTDILSNFSEGYCRVNGAFLFRGDVDVNISDWLRLPPAFELKPLFAFQFQRLAFTDHDGQQQDFITPTHPTYVAYGLEGNSIKFRQDWYMYMIGLRSAYNFDLNKNLTIKIKGEADWGPALGYNEDHHLQREGDLWGYISSYGSAMYFLAGLDMVIAKTFTIGMNVDYTWIRTSGKIHDCNFPEGLDRWWSDGVKAYSDQLGLTARVAYAF